MYSWGVNLPKKSYKNALFWKIFSDLENYFDFY